MASEFIKVTDKIYYFSGEPETDRPFLYYIKGRAYSVAIDAGQSKEHVEQFYSALQKESLPLPDYTLLTHWHWDHSFGLPYIHGKSVGSELTKQQLETVATWNWNKSDMEQRVTDGIEAEFVSACIQKVYSDLTTIQIAVPDIIIDHYNQHEIRLSRLTDYRTFINGLDFERYFLGHDYPDTKENVIKYLDELEQKAV